MYVTNLLWCYARCLSLCLQSQPNELDPGINQKVEYFIIDQGPTGSEHIPDGTAELKEQDRGQTACVMHHLSVQEGDSNPQIMKGTGCENMEVLNGKLTLKHL